VKEEINLKWFSLSSFELFKNNEEYEFFLMMIQQDLD